MSKAELLIRTWTPRADVLIRHATEDALAAYDRHDYAAAVGALDRTLALMNDPASRAGPDRLEKRETPRPDEDGWALFSAADITTQLCALSACRTMAARQLEREAGGTP